MPHVSLCGQTQCATSPLSHLPDNGTKLRTEMSLLGVHVAAFCGAASAFSIIAEDTWVSTLQHIYFPTCRVRCLQFLPTLSLFVLLSLDIRFQALC